MPQLGAGAATAPVAGVDVSLRRGLDVVLLDAGRVVDLRSRVVPEHLTGLLAEWRPAAVAIDAPSQWGVSGGSRTAERALNRAGIRCYGTPSDPAARSRPFYAWMHAGLAAYAAAASAGYPVFTGAGPARGSAMEAFPHATAVALHGTLPPAGWRATAASKRAWRLAALARAGVGADRLGTQDLIDAALAAVTAAMALAGHVDIVGEAAIDGIIVVPSGGRADRGGDGSRSLGRHL